MSPAAGVLPGSAEGVVCVVVVQRPGLVGSWPLLVALGTGGELGGCIAMASAAGQDGQTAWMSNLESCGCRTWWSLESICLA